MRLVKTFKSEIYVGFREQYTDKYHTYEELIDICKEYCDEVGLCVSIEKIDYVYTDGNESGAKVTLINYPRFPKEDKEIILTSSVLGNIIMKRFKQYRITIISGDKTVMLENEELKDKQ